MAQELPLVWQNPSPAQDFRRASHAWRARAVLVLRIVALTAIIGAALVCLASTVDGRVEAFISARNP